jgi:hypothetical protein
MTLRLRSLGWALAIALIAGNSLHAQPFSTWAVWSPGYPTNHSYVQVTHSPALNPTGGFTFEAWVFLSTPDSASEDCRSIAGKNYLQAWWVGVCNVGGVRTLRSYLKGGGSLRQGGRVAVNEWTHIAVVFDGVHRRHYINGELTLDAAETGPLTTSGSPLRIGSDVSWERSPTGAIDEARLWNVARSQAQLRAALGQAITSPQAGLVAVWALNGTTADVVGPYDGAPVGSGLFVGSFSILANCGAPTTATSLCLHDRFKVTARFRVGAQNTAEGQAQTVSSLFEGSGIFWFFDVQNWELMIKALNGCGLNNRFWIFNAGITNLYFRIEVLDVTKGVQRIYFNYPGPPAPAITDTDALAVCP